MSGKEGSGKSPEELYQEREKRTTDAIQLRVPDRVPISLRLSYFPARYNGITTEAAYYDAALWKQASKKLVVDLEPDTYASSTGTVSGGALEALDARQIKWPGHGVSPYHSHQLLEWEVMKEDEYDAFLNDPSDFIIRAYLPRIWGTMAPLARLPSLKSLIGNQSLAAFAGQMAAPDFTEALDALRKAAATSAEWQSAMNSFASEMAELGFPSTTGLGAGAPFDVISDYLRGMHGTMIDMYRRPDKLLQACEMLFEMQIDRISEAAKYTRNKRVFMALHRGSDGFLSLKQFETFYWPTLKKVILALVDAGLTPCPFFEGIYDSRLEYLLELPKGKVVCHFAQTDMFRAKEVLGGHLCIMGDVPSSLLQVASVQDVEEYCQKLIDICGKDGGYILTHMPIDEAKSENVKAMVDFTKSYGVYN